jgi:hypothetical protein
MPRRTLLSADARSRLLGIPTERAEMARHYVQGLRMKSDSGASAPFP